MLQLSSSLSTISTLTIERNVNVVESSSSVSSQHKNLKNNVTYQVLLVIGIILCVLFIMFACMYCYIKPNRKRRFFKRLNIFNRRGDFVSIDNEPLLILEDDVPKPDESKEGYFV